MDVESLGILVGVGLIAYALGGVLAAGIALVIFPFATAFLEGVLEVFLDQ